MNKWVLPITTMVTQAFFASVTEDAIKVAASRRNLSFVQDLGVRVGATVGGSLVGGYVTGIFMKNLVGVVSTVQNIDLNEDAETFVVHENEEKSEED